MTDRTVLDASLLARLVKGVAIVSKEMAVSSDQDGWHICMVDPSHTAMISVEGPASAFVEYAPFGRACFDTSGLDVVLKRGADVALTVKDGRLCAEAGSLVRRMGLLSDMPECRTPSNLPVSCRATFEASSIRDAVDAFNCKKVTMVRFSMTDETLTVTVEDGTDHVHVTVPKDDCLEWEHPGGRQSVDVCLSLAWVQTYLASIPRDELVTMSYSADYPVTMETSCKGARVAWVCAPMIMEE